MVKVKEADLVWSQICSSLLHSLIQEAFVASVLCWYCTRFWRWRAAAAAKLLQSCPTLCDPIDGSPPGSPVSGFSRQEYWSGLPLPSPMHESEKWKWSCSVVPDFATPWTAAYQASPSMGFSMQEYWSGLPLPSLNCLTSRAKLKAMHHWAKSLLKF